MQHVFNVHYREKKMMQHFPQSPVSVIHFSLLTWKALEHSFWAVLHSWKGIYFWDYVKQGFSVFLWTQTNIKKHVVKRNNEIKPMCPLISNHVTCRALFHAQLFPSSVAANWCHGLACLVSLLQLFLHCVLLPCVFVIRFGTVRLCLWASDSSRDVCLCVYCLHRDSCPVGRIRRREGQRLNQQNVGTP